jgi:hypothetical protein
VPSLSGFGHTPHKEEEMEMRIRLYKSWCIDIKKTY